MRYDRPWPKVVYLRASQPFLLLTLRGRYRDTETPKMDLCRPQGERRMRQHDARQGICANIKNKEFVAAE